MSVDLSTNGHAIHEAVENVRSPSHPSTWCILGFDKTKRIVKVVDTAEEEGEDDDLDELESSFNDAKCQFGFVTIKDENTGLNKFVFISWCGDAVLPMDKSRFPQQVEAVAKVFPGAHVVIDARDSRDVKKSDMRKKVAKSSGANYSVHKEKANPLGYAPEAISGSGYKKDEIAWNRSDANNCMPEAISGSGYQKAEIVRGNASSFKERFEPSGHEAHNQKTQHRLSNERTARQAEDAATFAAQPQVAEEAPVKAKRISQIARDQASEQGGSGISLPPRGGFAQTPPQQEVEASASSPQEYSDAPAQEYSDAPQEQYYETPAPKHSETPAQEYNDAPAQEYNETHNEAPAQEYSETHNEAPSQQLDMPPRPQERHETNESQTQGYTEAHEQEEAYDWGICATTMYDYQAQGDDEIGFDVNEVITNIEKFDEDWWRGQNVHGRTGIFPANYVEEMPPQ